ncbi:MAG TPA: Uma2 family endonuclease [Chroococcidiopsis sp.]
MVLSNQPDVPIFPPAELESDEPQMETYRHLLQLILLLTSLERLWSDRQDFFAAGNLTVYYSIRERRSEDFRGPDFFVVLNTERRERKSWVVWAENGQYPNFILEVLSDSTAQTDRGLKKQLYQDVFRTPDYFWFHPYTQEFQGFKLVYGEYQEIPADDRGWRWSEELQLYLGIHDEMLRFFTPEGELVPTPTEAEQIALQQAISQQQRAEEERQRAEEERQRADRLAEKLRQMGIDPEDVS